MDDEVAIKVENVSKKYCKSLKRSMFYGIKDIGRNMLGMSSHSENLRKNEFWALDDVSFAVKKGETLGIIGPNGSGKTTLLKLLNGIFWPDKGKITVKGKMGALIQVGAGFHPLLTGRENVYLNAAILGMTKKEVDERFDSILEFADIGDFIDAPVKFYSSGMFVRLGFAVAVHCEPDVLLVDEVLAVGDINFQRKCFKRMKELFSSGTSIIFVTHNLFTLGGLCDQTILLNNGRIHTIGDTEKVVEVYELQEKEKDISKDISQYKNKQKYDEFQPIEIINCELLDMDGNPRTVFKFDEQIKIRIHLIAHQRIENPLFVFAFKRSDEIYVSHANNRFDNFDVDFIEGEVFLEVELSATHLVTDLYSVVFSIWSWNNPIFFKPDIENVIQYVAEVVGRIKVKHPFLFARYGVFQQRIDKWTFKNDKRKLIHTNIPDNAVYEVFKDEFKDKKTNNRDGK